MNNYHNVLIEAKNEYTKQLTKMLAPCIFEGLESVYEYVEKDTKMNNQYLKEFQKHLSDIPKWTKDMIKKEYDRIISKIDCDWMEDLITAVFVSHTKVLTVIKMTDKSNSIDLKVPTGYHFLHKCYIESARQIWKRPYLFDHKLNNLEKQRNLNEAENIIVYSIEETVRNLLPVRTILKEYLGKNYEDDIEDDLSYHIPRAHQNNLKNMVKKEIELSLNNIAKQDDVDDNYSNYKLETEVLEKKSMLGNENLMFNDIESIDNNSESKKKDKEKINNNELMDKDIEKINDNELVNKDLDEISDKNIDIEGNNDKEIDVERINDNVLMNNNIEMINNTETLNDDNVEMKNDTETFNDDKEKNDNYKEDTVLMNNDIEMINDTETLNDDGKKDDKVLMNNNIEIINNTETVNDDGRNDDNKDDIENINRYSILELEEELNKIADKSSLILDSNLDDNNLFYNDATFYRN